MLPVVIPPAIAKLRRAGAYDERVAPGEGIWGGMMLPDSLPILANGCGDALLLRFAPDGTAREVVAWRHEGGQWHPTDLVRGFAAPDDARRRDAERALRPGVLAWCERHGGAALAEALGVPWATLAPGLDDTDVLDAELRARIAKVTGRRPAALFTQDWDGAARIAGDVQRSDLSWPGAVLGRAAEKRGDRDAAVAAYRRCLDGFRTTAAFTEGWDLAAWTRGLGMALEPRDAGALRERWMTLGREHLRGGRATQAYDAFFRAGWDDLFTNDMVVVLDHLCQAAEATGSAALTSLARLHRDACV